ncbi:MAG: hypothetical protein COC06_06055 [Bacteroidales bacterium]|nr:MAG: hypothetical protein COC06_06055 [Bacteroidales bacterium]
MENATANTEFIRTLISAGIALMGVLIGIIVTTIVNWKIKTKESRLRILEKLYDKRLIAHESFLRIPKLLRTTVSTKNIDENNYFITYIGILNDKKMYENFLGEFYESMNFNSHWFNNDLKKEVWFAQEYLQNVDSLLSQISDENCIKLATMLKSDFTSLANRLEEKTLEFLQTDIQKINIKNKEKDSEFSVSEKQKRFSETDLVKLKNEINELKK